jgi:hypothetical protein
VTISELRRIRHAEVEEKSLESSQLTGEQFINVFIANFLSFKIYSIPRLMTFRALYLRLQEQFYTTRGEWRGWRGVGGERKKSFRAKKLSLV